MEKLPKTWSIEDSKLERMKIPADIDMENIPVITVKAYEFNVFEHKYYVVTKDVHYKYIKMYIDSIVSGNPDKESVIRQFGLDQKLIPESTLNFLIEQGRSVNFLYGNSHSIGSVVSELNQIERDLKFVIDAKKRESKIDDLL